MRWRGSCIVVKWLPIYIYWKKMDENVSYYDIIFNMALKIQNWHGCLNWITCNHGRVLLFIKYAFYDDRQKSLRRWLLKSFLFITQPITRHRNSIWIDTTNCSNIIDHMKVLDSIRLLLHPIFRIHSKTTNKDSHLVEYHLETCSMTMQIYKVVTII